MYDNQNNCTSHIFIFFLRLFIIFTSKHVIGSKYKLTSPFLSLYSPVSSSGQPTLRQVNDLKSYIHWA